MSEFKPLILCIGGTTRAGSSTEKALRHVARLVEGLGATPLVMAGPELVLPNYPADRTERSDQARSLVDAIRRCDGLVIASPGYHGNYSGLVKNVLDYIEDLAHEPSPYLDGKPVGCIASAFGWQAIGTTLVGLRSVVHALRGWNAPTGGSINSTQKIFDESGSVVQPEVKAELEEMTRQVVEFARMKQAWGRQASRAVAALG
jgi:FMN reductase